ncbi:MAG: glycosyltransferase family 4 protein [Opitutales bacterium]|nr:glycosyltransferase family 4 protein [Opitutales bacterium]
MSEKQRVLFISEFAGFIGGTEKFIFESARLLAQNGRVCDMIFKTKTRGYDEFAGAFEHCLQFEDSAPLENLEYEIKTMHRTEDARFLRFALERHSPTLFVHDHIYWCPKGYKYYPFGRVNCRRTYSRTVCGLCSAAVPPRHYKNGAAEMLKRNFAEMPALNRTALEFPKFAVISDFMARELEKNGAERSRIKKVSPFVDLPEAPAGREPGEFRILFAGQHVISKGLHLLIDALSKMKSDFRADILGQGARTEFFKELAKKRGMESKLNFLGFQTDPSPHFARADVVAFPSLWQEPFGLVGIEAMANAKAVVGFDVGGISEWLKDGVNGILVKERDVSAFAEALDALAHDAARRERMGEAGREMAAERFSKEQFLKSFLLLK